MVQRYQDQSLQNMPLERKSRKLSVMRSLSRGSFKQYNKENENPLYKNMEMALNFTHSTPVKNNRQIHPENVVSNSDSEMELRDNDISLNVDSEKIQETKMDEESKPKLVIAKLYDSVSDNMSEVSKSASENQCSKEEIDKTNKENYEIEVCETDVTEIKEDIRSENYELHWKSLEVLDETAEDEFYKSLEKSKLFMSSSSLLEEIEAELPSPYSLLKPFNYTFQTLNSYRNLTRRAQSETNLSCPDNIIQRESFDIQKVSSDKMHHLEMEATVQDALGKQAEKALNLCKTQKLTGVEFLESEKTLLLANLRFNATQQEMEKLKIYGDVSDDKNFGQLTISDISFTVDSTVENNPGHYICTATESGNVQASSIVSKTTDGKLLFEDRFEFQDLGTDFVIYIEVFRIYSKEPKLARLTTSLFRKKKKSNLGSSLSCSSCTLRSCNGLASAKLNLSHITQDEKEECVIPFTQVSQYPIRGETVKLFAKIDLKINLKMKGFLNVFKQTWHRRWYSQSGFFLESWAYPEDQDSEKPPLDSIYLPEVSSEVRSCTHDICVRSYSFIITLRQNEFIFSADSYKEMNKWIDHLNLIIETVRVWKTRV